MALAANVYRLTREMPRQEEYRLSAQMIRAAASVPANIAEGYARSTRKDYANFVSIARGSLAELETFLQLASDLSLVPGDRCKTVMLDAEEIGRMLTSLRSKLSGSPSPQRSGQQ
jgi:four helix bundle protein